MKKKAKAKAKKRSRSHEPPADRAYLLPEQARLCGHERYRAVVANLTLRGLSVEQIADVTGYKLAAVVHHLEEARRLAMGTERH